jgi:hypothetical protein
MDVRIFFLTSLQMTHCLFLISSFFRSQCNGLSSNQTLVNITAAILYPKHCGRSKQCKENFSATAQTKVAGYKASFPISITFADGQSTLTHLTLCNSIADTAKTSSSTSDTITGGKKLNYFVVFVAGLEMGRPARPGPAQQDFSLGPVHKSCWAGRAKFLCFFSTFYPTLYLS